MKKLIFISSIFIFFSAGDSVYAQSVELTPIAGYTFPERFDVNQGEARVSGGFTYGGILTFDINDNYGVELIYTRQDADAEVNSFYLVERNVPVSVNYIQAGGARYFPVNAMTRFFAGLNLGAAGLVPKEEYEQGWLFAVGLKGGVKYYFTDRVGLRVQANMQMPVQWAGAGFFIGTGGSGVTVDTFSTIFQFSFTGGLVFKLSP